MNEGKAKANMKVKTCTYHSSKSMSFCIISEDDRESRHSVESENETAKDIAGNIRSGPNN